MVFIEGEIRKNSPDRLKNRFIAAERIGETQLFRIYIITSNNYGGFLPQKYTL
jgi:hypothetical protein